MALKDQVKAQAEEIERLKAQLASVGKGARRAIRVSLKPLGTFYVGGIGGRFGISLEPGDVRKGHAAGVFGDSLLAYAEGESEVNNTLTREQEAHMRRALRYFPKGDGTEAWVEARIRRVCAAAAVGDTPVEASREYAEAIVATALAASFANGESAGVGA